MTAPQPVGNADVSAAGNRRPTTSAEITTVCTATRFGHHDYSKLPHNTPDNPRDSEGEGCCFGVAADPFGRCEHDRRFEVVIYQPGTHDWIRAQGCGPCVMTLRERDRHWHWVNVERGIYSIRELGREAVNA